MASKASALGALLYEEETQGLQGEAVTTTGTRLRPIGSVDCAPTHEGIEVEILRNRPNEGVQVVRGIQGGTIGFDLNLTGLGATCAGAAPASALATFLGTVFGTTATGLATGSTATGGTASVPTTTGATGITAGALTRWGAKGDARADGQWAACGSHSGSSATLLTALPGAPSNGDVMWASRMVYGSQTPGTYETLKTVRFKYQSAQQNYIMHGCYPTSAQFSINVGEIPRIRVNYGISRWDTIAGTLPSAVSVQDYGAAAVAGGSMFMAALGTVTRSTQVVRSVMMNVELNNIPENGLGGYSEHQGVTGSSRGPTKITVEMVVDSEAAGTDTFGDLFNVSENSRVSRHALYSMSVADGRSLAIYWPNLVQLERPVQFDDGGVLRKRLRFRADAGGAASDSDLLQSPFRIGMS